MGHEFRYGDVVRHKLTGSVGVVVDERHQNTIHGSFDACVPWPVAVQWRQYNEVWWVAGEYLEEAGCDLATA